MQLPLPGAAPEGAVPAPGFKVGSVGHDAFGVVVDAPGQIQWAVRKELRNKLAWVLGTCYGVNYSARRDVTRIYADLIAQSVLRDHGYPGK